MYRSMSMMQNQVLQQKTFVTRLLQVKKIWPANECQAMMLDLRSDGEKKGGWRYGVTRGGIIWQASCLGVKTSGYLIHRFYRIVRT